MTDELAATPDVPPEQPAGAVHWHRDTSWDDLEVKELPNGVRSRGFVIDSGDDRDAPTVFWSYFPPHTVTAPHSHQCDYAEIILHGSQQVTRRWYKAGDVRIVKAGTVYGPLVAGPEGATVIVIFRHSNWEPVPARQSDTDGLFVGEIARLMACTSAASRHCRCDAGSTSLAQLLVRVATKSLTRSIAPGVGHEVGGGVGASVKNRSGDELLNRLQAPLPSPTSSKKLANLVWHCTILCAKSSPDGDTARHCPTSSEETSWTPIQLVSRSPFCAPPAAFGVPSTHDSAIWIST